MKSTIREPRPQAGYRTGRRPMAVKQGRGRRRALSRRARSLAAARLTRLVRVWLADPAFLPAAGWAVVALGLLLRLCGLGSRSLWFDEIITLTVPSQPWSNLLQAAATPGTNTPPLFPILYKLWMLGGTGDAWLNLGTALIGGGVVAVTWLAGRRLFGVPVAGVATALCALSAYQVTYSQYVRMYSLLALTGIASVYLLARAAEGKRRRWWWLWAGSVAACLYSFYYAGFLLVGECIWLWRQARRRPAIAPAALRAVVAALLLYAPWLPAMLHQSQDAGSRAWMAHPTLFSLQFTIEQFFFTDSSAQVAAVGPVVVVILAVLGIVLPGAAEERLLLGLVAGCGIMLPYLASFIVEPLYDPRYVVYGAIALYLFAARGLLWIISLLRTDQGRRAQAITVLATMLAVFLYSIGPLNAFYTQPVSYRPDLRGATASLLRAYRPGDVIVYDDVFEFLPAIWYAHQSGVSGTRNTSMPYTFVPVSWVRRAPMRQLLLNPYQITAHWLPRGQGRIWMVTAIGVLHAHQRPRVPRWFAPPAGGWKLVHEDTRFYRLLIRLYVRR